VISCTLARSAPPASPPTSTLPRRESGRESSEIQVRPRHYNIAAAWNLDDLLKACSAAGISPVEFRTTHKHGVEPTLSKDQRQEVKKKCADKGVEIWGCGTVCEFHSDDMNVVKKNIETCKEFVQLVADLGGAA